MGRTTVNVSDDVLKKILRIKQDRPQDASRNETLNFVLDFYLEYKNKLQESQPKPAIKIYGEAMTLKAKTHIIPGNIASPIIDAEKAQKDFIQLGGEKL